MSVSGMSLPSKGQLRGKGSRDLNNGPVTLRYFEMKAFLPSMRKT